ncbi:MAG TPA: enoyl-CoA hydratase-related protein [Candidatus Acidoferrales bacterium]|nr:enoyl-CoA hydratase-related protein [Candidatus Acidoferrales bacterium]
MHESLATYETIALEVEDAIAVVTLNRPKALNALNTLMLTELSAAFQVLDGDRRVRAVILTGAGEKAFAAGADIAELSQLRGAAQALAVARLGQGLTQQMERLRPAVIAAVNGFALGGGCELALACDIRIASTSARFGQPEVNLGLMPGFGGTQRTARLLGRGMAMYLCLSGEVIDAGEALRIGLCERVVPPEALLSESKRLAGQIAAKAPLAIAATKRAIDLGVGVPMHEALAIEALTFSTLVDTADFSEGTRAFLEKRVPSFTGS